MQEMLAKMQADMHKQQAPTPSGPPPPAPNGHTSSPAKAPAAVNNTKTGELFLLQGSPLVDYGPHLIHCKDAWIVGSVSRNLDICTTCRNTQNRSTINMQESLDQLFEVISIGSVYIPRVILRSS